MEAGAIPTTVVTMTTTEAGAAEMRMEVRQPTPPQAAMDGRIHQLLEVTTGRVLLQLTPVGKSLSISIVFWLRAYHLHIFGSWKLHFLGWV